MRVLVTGGCGYKGSVLVPKLLRYGHKVTVLDTQWFGNTLSPHRDLDFMVGDIRELGDYQEWLRDYAAVIHLAAIANDPCGDLDAKLTWEVNALATMRLADACVRVGVKQFIYASSASVYGIKDNVPVTEDTEMCPVSDYNRTKMVAERALLSYQHEMAVQIVRPATVCGVSARMRFDVVVNMLTAQALTAGKIVAHCGAHGGTLMRPNTHIEDVTDLYCWLLDRQHLTGVWNAGFENLSVSEIAELIAAKTGADISYTQVVDKRSYCVDSGKLYETGFKPQHSVGLAVDEIISAWHSGTIKDELMCHNLLWMRDRGLARE